MFRVCTVITVADPRSALERLRVAAESESLAGVCERHGVRLLTAFGSAVRDEQLPNDLDLGVVFTASGDLLALYEDLVRLGGTESIDLIDLRRAGPVARERALVGAVLLYEREPGAFTHAQMGAMTERMETDRIRRADLELMAR
jgi:predicted nucleotidyltransferase